MTKQPINVNSEIGRLKTVLLKRPGKELENLVPNYLQRLLFDDIPFLKEAQAEHDQFAQLLRDEGVEVLYLEDLTAESIADPMVRAQFIEDVLAESKKTIQGHEEEIRNLFNSLTDQALVEKVMAGVRREDIHLTTPHLTEYMRHPYPFYMDPLPNLYFTRDPQAFIGNGVSVNQMHWPARRRETLFIDYILKHHSRFADAEIPIWYDRHMPYQMEGGDQLVLSKEVLAIGISERTSAPAVEEIARKVFEQPNSTFKKVIAIEIPNTRAFMHLDTVFTMIDYDKFTIHSAIQEMSDQFSIFIIEPDGDDIKIKESDSLKETLEDALHIEEVELIPTGDGDPIIGPREQWNDGSNTLTIRPGVVVTYDRNFVSNQLLRDKGIKVLEINGSELVRGRGGPRCMSQPIYREDI